VDVGVIINQEAYKHETHVQNGLNTYTGGTYLAPTVNISAATLDRVFVSGYSTFNLLSATTFSATTYFSGSTPLETIIVNLATSSSNTFVQPGLNTYTGGTNSRPTVNVSALTIDHITVSGDSNFTTLSATTLSAGTIFSGSSNLETLFLNKNGYLLQKANFVSGSTFAGNPKTAVVTFTTNFPNNNYAVVVTGTINRTWTVESKTLSGFTINANANPAFASSEVYWIATQNGEGFK